ncbi:oxt [Symbiodinium natans]|uniref:protein xylosyltransferase n=1 Tax=Symbiodinium natans TaxID=878477 RepID=A0A812RZD0_9DINO|nr:oxt [Symbiodinium natans]
MDLCNLISFDWVCLLECPVASSEFVPATTAFLGSVELAGVGKSSATQVVMWRYDNQTNHVWRKIRDLDGFRASPEDSSAKRGVMIVSCSANIGPVLLQDGMQCQPQTPRLKFIILWALVLAHVLQNFILSSPIYTWSIFRARVVQWLMVPISAIASALASCFVTSAAVLSTADWQPHLWNDGGELMVTSKKRFVDMFNALPLACGSCGASVAGLRSGLTYLGNRLMDPRAHPPREGMTRIWKALAKSRPMLLWVGDWALPPKGIVLPTSTPATTNRQRVGGGTMVAKGDGDARVWQVSAQYRPRQTPHPAETQVRQAWELVEEANVVRQLFAQGLPFVLVAFQRRAEDGRAAAFWASWADTLPTLRARHPRVVAEVLNQAMAGQRPAWSSSRRRRRQSLRGWQRSAAASLGAAARVQLALRHGETAARRSPLRACPCSGGMADPPAAPLTALGAPVVECIVCCRAARHVQRRLCLATVNRSSTTRVGGSALLCQRALLRELDASSAALLDSHVRAGAASRMMFCDTPGSRTGLAGWPQRVRQHDVRGSSANFGAFKVQRRAERETRRNEVTTLALTTFGCGAASLLNAAVANDRQISFKECMRRSKGGDDSLRDVLKRASPSCRKGLRSFYCHRVAGVPAIRSSVPLENFCEDRADDPAHPSGRRVFQSSPALLARIAFFVLAYGYPLNVGRLLQRLAPASRHVLVHVDEKRPDYLQLLEESVGRLGLEDKVSLRSRYRVNRGGVSTLAVWLWGMSWLLQNVEGWDYYINLNDSDYPVADLASLRRFLWLNNGSNFVNIGSAYKDCDCGRYLVYECKDELYSIAPETRYPRRPELNHASGPNLVAITWDFAHYIDTNRDVALTPVQQVLEDLSILQQPDEKFFQTMSLNSPFCHRHVRWGFHIWDRPRLAPDASSPEVAGPELKMLSPPVLNESFWPLLAEVKSKGMAVFFARKFDNNLTLALQDRIDAAIDGRSADVAWGSAGPWLPVKAARRLAWLKALFQATTSALAPEKVAAWKEAPRDGVYFGMQRYRASCALPCAVLSKELLPARRCRVRGRAVLEELAFRPAEALNASATSRSPLLAALRVGSGWNPEHFSFDMVSVVPVEALGQVDVVLYWSHAAVRGGEDGTEGSQQLEVLWRSPSGRSASSVSPFRPQLLSWSRLPQDLADSPAAGKWRVEAWLGGAAIGSRSFFACEGLCEGSGLRKRTLIPWPSLPLRG